MYVLCLTKRNNIKFSNLIRSVQYNAALVVTKTILRNLTTCYTKN